MDFRQFSDQELLKKRLKDFSFEFKGSWIEPLTEEICAELNALGIQWRPHFWLSNEWFSPDGIPGVALPFYIFSQRLIKMEKKYIGFCEGHTKESAMKLLRHEIGHAFDNAFACRKNKERQELFGSSQTTYKNSYKPRKYSKSYVKHLELNYAQSHPDEDFAETFAVFINPKSNWKTKYSHKSLAYKKLVFMEKLFKSKRNKKPCLRNNYQMETLNKETRTLEQYYISRKKELRIESEESSDTLLYDVFSQGRGTKTALEFIDEVKLKVEKDVARALGEHQYCVSPIIEKIRNRSKTLGLQLREKATEEEFRDMVLLTALEQRELNQHFF